MKPWMKFALAAVVVVAFLAAAILGGAYWFWCRAESGSPWSSESAEARAEIDAGLKDLEKAYGPDAALHFERARELDPKSPAALVLLAFSLVDGDPERATIKEEVAKLDPARFTDHERFLVGVFSAQTKMDLAEMSRVVEDYLSRHPEVAFAVSMRCMLMWDHHQWDEAEACYRQLLKEQPQWVLAQDRLGQLAMSRGRFAEAEDQFLTYRYIAPNQAGPYGSMGVLYLLTGRYEESEASFRKALEIKQDYCPALSGLTHLYTVWGKTQQALEMIAATEGQSACRPIMTSGFTCSRKIFNAYLVNDRATAEEVDRSCPAPLGYSLGKHQMAVWRGDFASALTMEAAVEKNAGADPAKQAIPFVSGYLHYLRGVRLLGQDQYPAAADEFKQADGELRYWTGDTAILTLVNHVQWVYSLELAGRKEEAAALRKAVATVNPRLLESMKIPALEAKLAARHP